jgi:hypothetical protein
LLNAAIQRAHAEQARIVVGSVVSNGVAVGDDDAPVAVDDQRGRFSQRVGEDRLVAGWGDAGVDADHLAVAVGDDDLAVPLDGDVAEIGEIFTARDDRLFAVLDTTLDVDAEDLVRAVDDEDHAVLGGVAWVRDRVRERHGAGLRDGIDEDRGARVVGGVGVADVIRTRVRDEELVVVPRRQLRHDGDDVGAVEAAAEDVGVAAVGIEPDELSVRVIGYEDGVVGRRVQRIVVVHRHAVRAGERVVEGLRIARIATVRAHAVDRRAVATLPAVGDQDLPV